ncbi:MAG TPA: hypothetical protein VN608_01660 [Clostridia bacterium]|nr:hypothetical protein [Clostridia bacterium]
MFERKERYVLTVEKEHFDAICQCLMRLYNRLIAQKSMFTAQDVNQLHTAMLCSPHENGVHVVTLNNVEERNFILNAVTEKYIAAKDENKREELNLLAVLYKRVMECPTQHQYHKQQRGAAQRAGVR